MTSKQIVLYEGRAWVCIRQHTSSIFQNDQTYTPPGNTLPDPAWVKMTDGYEFKRAMTATPVVNEVEPVSFVRP